MAEESRNSQSNRTTGIRGALGSFLLLALPLLLLACGATDADSGSTGGKVFDPQLPSSTFQSTQDPAERDRIAQEIWDALIRPQCWDASFIGPATPSFVEVNTARERSLPAHSPLRAVRGSAASVSQFTFSGPAQYRYYGFSIYSGSVGLQDVGHYKGKPAVLMSTWTGDAEGLILVDDTHFEHVLTNPSGAYYSVTFWTSNGPCL
jgi:hypothetical protein